MPEGSSSEAPVIKPGPSTLKKRLKGFFSCVMAASSEPVPPVGSECGMTGASLRRDDSSRSPWVMEFSSGAIRCQAKFLIFHPDENDPQKSAALERLE